MHLIDYSLYFFLYAFLGWCCEVCFATLKSGKLVNRGFLNGPLCPIYGLGCIGIIAALSPLSNKLLLLFVSSIVFTSALEFITGFLLGSIFKQKWWDYSKEPFNIKGYVCLRMSILWGLACVFLVKIIHPPVSVLIGKIPTPANLITALVLFAVLATDIIVSVFQLIKHKNYLRRLQSLLGDKMDDFQAKMRKPSDKISGGIYIGTVKSVTELNELASLIKKSRLVKAFPALGDKLGFEEIVKKFDASGKIPEPTYPVFASDSNANTAENTSAESKSFSQPDGANEINRSNEPTTDSDVAATDYS